MSHKRPTFTIQCPGCERITYVLAVHYDLSEMDAHQINAAIDDGYDIDIVEKSSIDNSKLDFSGTECGCDRCPPER